MTVPPFRVRPLLLFILLLAMQSVSAAPVVVTTIRPLQLIAEDLMQGVAEPRLLNAQSADPHHMNLKVSDRRLLAEAGILLWVGPDMELPLVGLVDQLSAQAIAASEIPQIVRLAEDPHVWLDSQNGLLIGETLASALITADPDNSEQYRRNLASFRQSVLDAEQGLRQLLGQRTPSFAVYHNAYGYFEARFGLGHPLSLTANEALSAGARQLRQLQVEAASGKLSCLMLEPEVNPDQLRQIVSESSLKIVINDPLGYQVTAGENRYAALLEAVGSAFAECFEGAGHE